MKASYKMRKAIERLEKKYGKGIKHFFNDSVYLDESVKSRGFYDICHFEAFTSRVLFYFLITHSGRVYRYNR